eukprot:3254725-Alexandrium_andersonii.AAC.1
MPPKRRRARLDREAVAAHAGVATRSHVAHTLENMFSLGLISSLAVQELASAALRDGAEHERLQMLSSIGASGKLSVS